MYHTSLELPCVILTFLCAFIGFLKLHAISNLNAIESLRNAWIRCSFTLNPIMTLFLAVLLPIIRYS